MQDFQGIRATQITQTFPHRWMLDFINAVHTFRLKVAQAVAVIEKRGQNTATEIQIPIYGTTQHRSAVFLIICGKVSAAAEKGNSVRCSGDNQNQLLVLTA
jgi:hypothetical protein